MMPVVLRVVAVSKPSATTGTAAAQSRQPMAALKAAPGPGFGVTGRPRSGVKLKKQPEGGASHAGNDTVAIDSSWLRCHLLGKRTARPFVFLSFTPPSPRPGQFHARRACLYPPVHAGAYHDRTTAFVRAEAQAAFADRLLASGWLRGAERDVLAWGRAPYAAKPPNVPRRFTAAGIPAEVYRRASAFESLVGYLYLADRGRLDDLLAQIEPAAPQGDRAGTNVQGNGAARPDSEPKKNGAAAPAAAKPRAKKPAAEAPSGWSVALTQRLFEAAAEFPESEAEPTWSDARWARIASRVKGKSPQECRARFRDAAGGLRSGEAGDPEAVASATNSNGAGS